MNDNMEKAVVYVPMAADVVHHAHTNSREQPTAHVPDPGN